MGKVRDSIDEVIGKSNPVGFWQRLHEVPLGRRISRSSTDSHAEPAVVAVPLM
ncbi:MAG: hypothetical protein WD274_06950 [Acidimicrobiia bacterium]